MAPQITTASIPMCPFDSRPWRHSQVLSCPQPPAAVTGLEPSSEGGWRVVSLNTRGLAAAPEDGHMAREAEDETEPS